MKVGELIDILKKYPDNYLVYFRDDNDYTVKATTIDEDSFFHVFGKGVTLCGSHDHDAIMLERDDV